MNPTCIANLLDEVEVPANGILSRTVYEDSGVKAVLFAFSADQELSEHTASMPAVLHMLQGEAEWTLGDHATQAKPGAWAHMPAHLPHSIRTRTPAVMLLLLIKGEHSARGG